MKKKMYRIIYKEVSPNRKKGERVYAPDFYFPLDVWEELMRDLINLYEVTDAVLVDRRGEKYPNLEIRNGVLTKRVEVGGKKCQQLKK